MSPKVIIALVCAVILLCTGCAAEKTVLQEEYSDTAQTGFRRTVLYYSTQDGTVVPVTKLIPWEEGIGKAALSYLTKTEDNNAFAASLGLDAVIPAGVEMSLRIGDDGRAKVDIKNFTELASAEAEQAMVTCIVNTLTEFPAIETVGISIDGKSKKTLTNGTQLPDNSAQMALNIEESELSVATDDAYCMTLYYPNAAASLYVPVTRYTELKPGFESAVRAMCEVPKNAGLLAVIPEGTEVISASIDSGVAKVDFSAAIKSVKGVDGMSAALAESLLFTANEHEEVYAIEIFAEGEVLETVSTQTGASMYINEY